jgi:hypothetical protein
VVKLAVKVVPDEMVDRTVTFRAKLGIGEVLMEDELLLPELGQHSGSPAVLASASFAVTTTSRISSSSTVSWPMAIPTICCNPTGSAVMPVNKGYWSGCWSRMGTDTSIVTI